MYAVLYITDYLSKFQIQYSITTYMSSSIILHIYAQPAGYLVMQLYVKPYFKVLDPPLTLLEKATEKKCEIAHFVTAS